MEIEIINGRVRLWIDDVDYFRGNNPIVTKLNYNFNTDIQTITIKFNNEEKTK